MKKVAFLALLLPLFLFFSPHAQAAVSTAKDATTTESLSKEVSKERFTFKDARKMLKDLRKQRKAIKRGEAAPSGTSSLLQNSLFVTGGIMFLGGILAAAVIPIAGIRWVAGIVLLVGLILMMIALFRELA